MKKHSNTKTELVFILDKSGSMSGLEKDTIGGFNSLLKKQKKQKGEARVTTVLFDDRYEILHKRVDIQLVGKLTENEYFVEGSTALLDAIGKTIKKVKAVQKKAGVMKADNVLFVIITDGMENASRKYSGDEVRQMVENQKEKGWEFLFLGANIDAVATAAQFGIGADRAADYHADSTGTKLNYEVLSKAISEVRESRPLCSSWKKKIDKDFKERAAE